MACNPYRADPLTAAQKALYASIPQQWAAMPSALSRADPTLTALIARGLVDITYVGQQRRRGESSQPQGWNWRKTYWRQFPNVPIGEADAQGDARGEAA